MQASGNPNFVAQTSITESDIKEFVARRVTNMQCAACGGVHWSLMGDANAVFTFMGCGADGSFNLPPPMQPVVNMACNRCYLVRSHALGPIIAWRNAGKPA